MRDTVDGEIFQRFPAYIRAIVVAKGINNEGQQPDVEEMLRYDAPLHLFHRFVLDDIQIAGVDLKRGDKVGLLYGSGNRDLIFRT